MKDQQFITIYFDDESPLLQAIGKLRESNENIIDVLTPFPVHGLDKALAMKRSRIPIIGFIFGTLGALIGFGFQAWVFTSGYPLDIGGKPLLAIPSFIPVTFECAILCAGLSMVAALLIKSKLKPDKNFVPLDEDITDDKFVILLDTKNGKITKDKVRSALSGIKIAEIK
jgi:hypothetical protein